MANDLYYIPLDIGAWLKDTSCVSMDTQGCLLNLTFKLWDSKAKGLLSISFSQLSILWRKTPEECQKTIAEIQENDLLNVTFLPENMVKFESRRMTKKAAKSLKMSENGKLGGRPKKAKENQAESKLKAKTKQNPNYNSYSDYKVEKGKRGTGEKTKTTAQIAFDLIPDTFHGDEFAVLWDDYEKLRKKKNRPLTETAVKQRLNQLRQLSGDKWSIAKVSMEETISSGWDKFFAPNPNHNQQPIKNERREIVRDKA